MRSGVCPEVHRDAPYRCKTVHATAGIPMRIGMGHTGKDARATAPRPSPRVLQGLFEERQALPDKGVTVG
ncbi:MAG TPA: hypothetical protein VMZ50_02810, partial [Phycisphaerae bacterium]|nr:hypothetical protein [Phycisphaerae bacterium]